MRLAWQAGILIIIAAGLVNLAGAVFQSFGSGTFGLETTNSAARNQLRVTGVTAGSPAAQAGIRSGDVLVYTPSAANVQVLTHTVAGDGIAVRDGNRSIELTAVPNSSATPGPALLVVTGIAKIAFAAMAILIIWRRPDDSAARSLALFLATFSFGMLYDIVALPFVWARVLSSFLVPAAFFIGMLGLLSFACRFPSLPSRGFRRTLAKALPAIAIVCAVLAFVPLTLTLLAGRSYSADAPYISIPPLIAQGFIIVAIFAALAAAYFTSAPQDRPRMRWLVGTLIAGFSGIAVIVGGAIAGANPDTPNMQYFALTIIVVPFGLAYVILRHRMLDISFVINRAVVYTSVSAVVVGSFIAFEWILGHFVEQNSRASSALQLAGALVLGFSVRYIHNKVDQYVDDIFFRERHQAEAAVRRFAHEALLITDMRDLVDKTTEMAQRNMRLAACAFYSRRDGDYIALRSTFAHSDAVSENDYAVLEMRTWHSPVSLHDTQTLLPGELALPMVVRGELTGFLLCGDKQNHEAFAPDERDALEQLARDAGIALDSLRVRELERELSRLELRAPDATGGGAPAL